MIDLVSYWHHVADLPVRMKGTLEYVLRQVLLLHSRSIVLEVGNAELHPLWHQTRTRKKFRRSGCGCSGSGMNAVCLCEGGVIILTPPRIRMFELLCGEVG